MSAAQSKLPPYILAGRRYRTFNGLWRAICRRHAAEGVRVCVRERTLSAYRDVLGPAVVVYQWALPQAGEPIHVTQVQVSA